MRDPPRSGGRRRADRDIDRRSDRVERFDRVDREREQPQALESTSRGPLSGVEQTLKEDDSRSRFTDEVIAVSWNETGNRIACSKTDGSLRIWGMRAAGEPSSMKPLVVNKPHEKAIESLSWKPSAGTTLATVGQDRFLKVWNSVTGNVSQEFVIGSEKLILVAYSPDAKYIATVSLRDTVYILDAVTGDVVQKLAHDLSVHSISWTNTADFLLLGLGDGSIAMYYLDKAQYSLVHKLQGHRSSIKWIKVDNAGRYVFVASNEGVVSVWSLESLSVVKTFGDIDQPVNMVDASTHGDFMAITYDGDEPTRLFDTNTWKEIMTLKSCTSGGMTLPIVQFCPHPRHNTSYLYTTSKGSIVVSYRPSRD